MLTRRTFALLVTSSIAGAARAAAASGRRRGIRLGFDNFAVRAMGWDARRLVDHAEIGRAHV